MFMTEINIYTVRVMSSVVSLPKYTFPGQAQSSKHITSTCAHSFARNWQILFLTQWKGENDHRKYFRMNLRKRMLPDSVGSKLMTSWSPVGPASDSNRGQLKNMKNNLSSNQTKKVILSMLPHCLALWTNGLLCLPLVFHHAENKIRLNFHGKDKKSIELPQTG